MVVFEQDGVINPVLSCYYAYHRYIAVSTLMLTLHTSYTKVLF